MLKDPITAPSSDSARSSTWLSDLAEHIGATTAGPASGDVDVGARFPQESVDALRAERLLSAIVPRELGGLGVTIREMAAFIRVLSHYCTSSALVLAMHTIEVYALVHHGETPWLRALLARVVDEQILLANATSERPGPLGSGSLDDSSGAPRIDRETLACSYGLNADVIFTSVRRSPEATAEDTVYVAVPTASADLEQTTTWNTLGLRGTCSSGLRIRAEVDPGAVFPVPWPTILNNGHIEVRHILAGAAYVGLAEAALNEAHVVVRSEARRSIGVTPPSATRLAELLIEVDKVRALLAVAVSRFEELEAASALDDIAFVVSLDGLKISTTTVAAECATKALQICGIRGIHREGEMHIERIVRDAHAALVMFGNDGLLRRSAETIVIRKAI